MNKKDGPNNGCADKPSASGCHEEGSCQDKKMEQSLVQNNEKEAAHPGRIQ